MYNSQIWCIFTKLNLTLLSRFAILDMLGGLCRSLFISPSLHRTLYSLYWEHLLHGGKDHGKGHLSWKSKAN